MNFGDGTENGARVSHIDIYSSTARVLLSPRRTTADVIRYSYYYNTKNIYYCIIAVRSALARGAVAAPASVNGPPIKY
jgi:hypothetical protein